MHAVLLALAIALLAGMLMSRIAKLLGLPAVTAYLVTGILIGPAVLGKLGIDGLGFSHEKTFFNYIDNFEIISQVVVANNTPETRIIPNPNFNNISIRLLSVVGGGALPFSN